MNIYTAFAIIFIHSIQYSTSQQLHPHTIPVPLPIFINSNPFVAPQPQLNNYKRFSLPPFRFNNVLNNIKHFFNNGNTNKQPPMSPRLMQLLSNPQNQALLENFFKQHSNNNTQYDNYFEASNPVPKYIKPKEKDEKTVLLAAPYKVSPEIMKQLFKEADKLPDQIQQVDLMEKVLQAAKPIKKKTPQITPQHYAANIIKDIALPNIAATNHYIGDSVDDHKDQVKLFESLAKHYLTMSKTSNSPRPRTNPHLNHMANTENPVKKFVFSSKDKAMPKKITTILESYGVNTTKLKDDLNEKTSRLLTFKKLVDSAEPKTKDQFGDESRASLSLINDISHGKTEETNLIRTLLEKLDQQELNIVGKLLRVIIDKPSFLPRILKENLSDDIKHVLQVIQVLKFPQTLMQQSEVVTKVVPLTLVKTTPNPIRSKMWNGVESTTGKSLVPLVYWVDSKNREMSNFKNLGPMRNGEKAHKSIGNVAHERVDQSRLKPNYQEIWENKIYNSSPRVSPSYSSLTWMKPTKVKPSVHKTIPVKQILTAPTVVNSSGNNVVKINDEIPNRYRTAFLDQFDGETTTKWQYNLQSSDWKPLKNGNGDSVDGFRSSTDVNYYGRPVAYFNAQTSYGVGDVGKTESMKDEMNFRKEKEIKSDKIKSDVTKNEKNDWSNGQGYFKGSHRNEKSGELDVKNNFNKNKYWYGQRYDGRDFSNEKSNGEIKSKSKDNVKMSKSNEMVSAESYIDETYVRTNSRKSGDNHYAINEKSRKNYNNTTKSHNTNRYIPGKKTKIPGNNSDESVDLDSVGSKIYEKMKEKWLSDRMTNGDLFPCLTTTIRDDSNQDSESSASIPYHRQIVPKSDENLQHPNSDYKIEIKTTQPTFKTTTKSTLTSRTTRNPTTKPMKKQTTTKKTMLKHTTTIKSTPKTIATIISTPKTIATTRKSYNSITPQITLATESQIPTEFEFLKVFVTTPNTNISPTSPFPVYIPKIHSSSSINNFGIENSTNYNKLNILNNTTTKNIFVTFETDVNNKTTQFPSHLQKGIPKSSVFSTVNKLHEDKKKAVGITLRRIHAPTSTAKHEIEDSMQSFFPVGYWPKTLTSTDTTMLKMNPKRKINLRWFDDQD